MFKKTIQTIRTNPNPTQYLQPQLPSGYNTQRYQRYLPQPQQPKPSQRKNISSGQFSQLKKMQVKTPQLVIRECDPTQLNHYKKPMRQVEENMYQQYQTNSSNKKERVTINPRQKYDSNFKQPLQEIHYSDRDNRSSDRYSSSSSFQLFELQQQVETLKQYMLQSQNQQILQNKKLKLLISQVETQCHGGLDSVAKQVSTTINKQRQDIIKVNKLAIDSHNQIRHLREQFNAFVKDNQQKMESLVLEMNGANVKKSKNTDQFGVDLKSSAHCISGGVGTSMSVNFQNQNINLKLYNQTSAQLQMLKAQLQQCKQKIQLLQKDTKILQLEKKTSRQQPKESITQKIDLKQVEKMIIQKFSEQRKKNSFSEKIQDLSMKTKDLYKVYQDMDGNIKGMNDQFARVLNGTIIKKEKMLEAKVLVLEEKMNQVNEKITPSSMIESLKPQLQTQLITILQQRSSNTKVVKIRELTPLQKPKLQTMKNSQFTYLMDQDGHLLDCSGNYIVETLQNGTRQRLKIEKNLLYLLETQGIQVRSC